MRLVSLATAALVAMGSCALAKEIPIGKPQVRGAAQIQHPSQG